MRYNHRGKATGSHRTSGVKSRQLDMTANSARLASAGVDAGGY